MNKYFKFSLVRNPYDRAYSLYEYVKRQKIYEGSFENFFKNEIHKLPNKMWGDTMTNYLKGGLDVVFKYEKYPEMISFLKNKFGFNGDPNWANTNPENNVNEVQNFKNSEMYGQNKHWVPIINEVYKDDFENFDYKMLPW